MPGVSSALCCKPDHSFSVRNLRSGEVLKPSTQKLIRLRYGKVLRLSSAWLFLPGQAEVQGSDAAQRGVGVG
jgi:hypothetical protein